ncbi:SIS domain-containing protein [Anaerorhabdus sp.]|uniref:SIS domain-containing protein n=1 Tax=Anaerorhabdus sp. TaxID=1872524 RepID=UPI002B21F929|nr:SIS domain-containing protein [Anaerorhabdus sp.]MEA4874194.1 SIS domain-containing protein [Anaerorhabdus sp.]
MNETYMIDYIRYESTMVKEIVTNRFSYISELVEVLVSGKIKRIYFSGHGSPYNVGEIIRLMMSKLLRMEVTNDCPTLFNNHLEFNVNGIYDKEEMLLICPAQSGKTSGPFNAVLKAKELGIKTVCLTMNPTGLLAENSDIVIDKKSGEEISFAETKGHVASLTIMMLAVIEAAYKLETITNEEYQKYINGFDKVVVSMSEAVTVTMKWYEKYRDILMNQSYFTFIGYGPNYVTANEGGLKILETTLLPCLCYELEEYMHGKNQLVSKDSVIFFIAPKEKEQSRMFKLYEWCKKTSKNCILISSFDNKFIDENSITCNFADIEFLTTLEYLIPFQVISYLLANDLGKSTVIANHNNAGNELQTRIMSE